MPRARPGVHGAKRGSGFFGNAMANTNEPKVLAAAAKPIEVEPGVWSVLIGTRSYEVRGEGTEFDWRGTAFSLASDDANNGTKSGGGPAKIKALMPGKVIRVLVAEGDQVMEGQGIVVVEAMKMQNEMRSPRAGTVTSVRAEAGSTVAAGELLAVIE
jgi:biotin carboxyl carrier protein